MIASVPPVLLLTAGLGTRLDPITRLLAKAAVPLGPRTLVERVAGWLRESGVTDVVLNLHHRPETIAAVVGDGAQLGLRVRYSWEQPLLGSAGGPRHARPLLDADTFLVVNGDTLCHLDLAVLLSDHAASGAEVTMAVVPNPAPERYNSIVADGLGHVTGFAPRGTAAAGGWHFVGVQVVRSRVFDGLVDGEPAETVSGIYRELIKSRPGAVRILPTTAAFIDVGTPADYLAAARFVGGVIDSDNVIWSDAHVDSGAQLTRCIVAGPVRVPGTFAATDATIVPAAIFRAGDRATIHGDLAVFPFA